MTGIPSLRFEAFALRLRNKLPLALRAQARRVGAIPQMFNLDRLARWYGTDKQLGEHGYTPFYKRHLGHRRSEQLSILEFGVGGHETNTGGASLRMWRSFFVRSAVIGVDLYEKRLPKERRITILKGDQADVLFLAELAAAYGPFDVVVDDGSHRGDHINITFTALWPHVRQNGIYVIEDLSTAYHEGYRGGPPGTRGTSLSLLKSLLDGVQDQGDWRAHAVHVYPNIAFIEKA